LPIALAAVRLNAKQPKRKRKKINERALYPAAQTGAVAGSAFRDRH
jgi:hypothetical protein